MHLVGGQAVRHFTGVYHDKVIKSRVDSLPYIFHKLRIHRNLSRKSLAKKCGVSESYVYSVESGSIYPSLKFCLRCATEFDMNPNYATVKWANGRVLRFRETLLRRLKIEN